MDQHYTPLCAAFASMELELKPPFHNPGSTTASYDNYTPLKRKVHIISFGTHNDQNPKAKVTVSCLYVYPAVAYRCR